MKKEVTQKELDNLNRIDYFHLFGNLEAQTNITKMFQMIIDTRERLLTTPKGLPGRNNSGPD